MKVGGRGEREGRGGEGEREGGGEGKREGGGEGKRGGEVRIRGRGDG